MTSALRCVEACAVLSRALYACRMSVPPSRSHSQINDATALAPTQVRVDKRCSRPTPSAVRALPLRVDGGVLLA